ncbi:MAG: hypothetical protein IKW91_03315 [Bacteroidaceae bacterium]|nr:hypothetical protein [Bacteroidaceae bacterium]
MVVTTTDNQVVKFDVSNVRDVTFEEDIEDNHEYVDLGLPSGTLWATCNIGADSPEKRGRYYSWGEKQPEVTTYDWSTYEYCQGSENTMIKYCTSSDCGYNGFTDNLTELLSEDDVATAIWGSAWQMPSRAQFEELVNNRITRTSWTTRSGVSGMLIKSRANGNSIFLPAGGGCQDVSLINLNNNGYYWSRSLNTDNSNRAYLLTFNSTKTGTLDISVSDFSRYMGLSVRPVRKQ